MQQWLNFLPAADAFLGLVTAIVNLAATVINRRNAIRNKAESDGTD